MRVVTDAGCNLGRLRGSSSSITTYYRSINLFQQEESLDTFQRYKEMSQRTHKNRNDPKRLLNDLKDRNQLESHFELEGVPKANINSEGS